MIELSNNDSKRLYEKYSKSLQKEEELHEKQRKLYEKWEETMDEDIGKQWDQVMDEFEKQKEETNLLARELIECLYK